MPDLNAATIANIIAVTALLTAIGSWIFNIIYTRRTFAASYHPDIDQRLIHSTSGVNTNDGTRNQKTSISLLIRNLSSNLAVSDVAVRVFLSITENSRQRLPESEYCTLSLGAITPLDLATVNITDHLEMDLNNRGGTGMGDTETVLFAFRQPGDSAIGYYVSEALQKSPLQIRVVITYRASVRRAKSLTNEKTYKLTPDYSLVVTAPRETKAVLTGSSWTLDE